MMEAALRYNTAIIHIINSLSKFPRLLEVLEIKLKIKVSVLRSFDSRSEARAGGIKHQGICVKESVTHLGNCYKTPKDAQCGFKGGVLQIDLGEQGCCIRLCWRGTTGRCQQHP